MKLKKRKKSRKLRGFRLHGKSAKHHKGKGSRGGKGRSGTGKRGDQKKTKILNLPHKYFGKRGKIARKKKLKKKIKEINLDDLLKKLGDKKQGEFKNFKNKVFDSARNLKKFRHYKILGRGEINKALTIKAKAFSSEARKKIEKAGGKAITFTKGSQKHQRIKNGAVQKSP